jgi:hypothetical protein
MIGYDLEDFGRLFRGHRWIRREQTRGMRQRNFKRTDGLRRSAHRASFKSAWDSYHRRLWPR